MAILFKDVTFLDENFEIKEHQYVVVEGLRIKEISSQRLAGDYAEVIEGKGKLMIPGLYNTHTHLAMSLLRGYAEDMKLQDWLNTRVFPYEQHMDNDAIYWGTVMGIAEAIRMGTVSVSDMYMNTEFVGNAFIDTGMKGNISLMPPVGMTADPFVFLMGSGLVSFYHEFGAGRLRVDAAYHAEYSVRENFVRALLESVAVKGMQVQLHLSETKLEHEECKERNHGLTPTQFFDKCGVFELPTIAAHGVWVEDCDIEILKAKGVTIAHNPISNLKLASGICPAKRLLDAGVNVTLGTDGVASNNNLNLFEEMKVFAILQKYLADDPTAIPVKDVLYAVTMAGAKAQGREASGSIRERSRADLVLLDIDQPHWQPQHNLLNNLVYSALGTDVCLTMIDGKIVYKDGEYTTIDIEKAKFEANAHKDRILSKIN